MVTKTEKPMLVNGKTLKSAVSTPVTMETLTVAFIYQPYLMVRHKMLLNKSVGILLIPGLQMNC